MTRVPSFKYGGGYGAEAQPSTALGYCDRHRWLHEKDSGPTPPCRNWEAQPSTRGEANGDAYHEHLNTCKQCTDKPFDLCSIGRRLLIDEATAGLRLRGMASETRKPIHSDRAVRALPTKDGRAPQEAHGERQA